MIFSDPAQQRIRSIFPAVVLTAGPRNFFFRARLFMIHILPGLPGDFYVECIRGRGSEDSDTVPFKEEFRFQKISVDFPDSTMSDEILGIIVVSSVQDQPVGAVIPEIEPFQVQTAGSGA
jgi:hypothetical protein